MPESTIEPDVIQLRRIRIADEGMKLDLLVHWDIVQETVADGLGETHTQYSYKECEWTEPYQNSRSKISEFLTSQEQQLLLKSKAKYEEERDTSELSIEEKSKLDDLQGIIYGTISDIDTNRSDKKYVQVEKIIETQTLQRWCYVTYSVLLAYQNAALAIGDYVIIEFVDNDLDKPIVIDKVIGF